MDFKVDRAQAESAAIQFIEGRGLSLDGLKIEALDFGAWSRDLNLTRDAVLFGAGLNWPKDSLHHMLAVFQPGYAWERECGAALGEGAASANLWAFDHVCLFGTRTPPVLEHSRAPGAKPKKAAGPKAAAYSPSSATGCGGSPAWWGAPVDARPHHRASVSERHTGP